MSAEKYLLETLKNSSKEDMDDYKAWLDISHFRTSVKLERVENTSRLYQSPHIAAEVIEISDDSDKDSCPPKKRVKKQLENENLPPSKRPRIKRDPSELEAPLPPLKFHKTKAEDIEHPKNLCESDSDIEILPSPIRSSGVNILSSPLEGRQIPSSSATPSSPLVNKRSGTKRKDARTNGKIRVTRKETVDEVVYLDKVPVRWPISVVDTAYVIDLGDDGPKFGGETKTGKPKGLDAFLKAEDQDAWGGGSNGSTSRDSKLVFLDNLAARRSVHTCKGALNCQFFDKNTLKDYQRTDPSDMTLTQGMFQKVLDQNNSNEGTVICSTSAFYRTIRKMHCTKVGCTGDAVLKRLSDPPSVEGKNLFVACSHWLRTERWDHLYAAIPAAVDEGLLRKFMDGSQIPELEDHSYYREGCSTFVHPRHKSLECNHPHFVNNQLVIGNMVPYMCPAIKIVYTSKDPERKIVVVIFRGHHTHPPWPLEKPTQAAKEDLENCVQSLGSLGATGGRINNAATTHALLGTTLSDKHGAYRNKRLLRVAVQKKKEESVPAGLQWPGIVNLHNEDLKLPITEQYIRNIRIEDDIKVVVTMNSELANLMHDADYLVCDFTFKRTQGEFNEWEVAIFHKPTRERVTTARIYCNRATRQAFDLIFEAFFSAIEKVTGRKLKFKAFDDAGNLLSIHFDMEAAQVQGFGDYLVKNNDSAVSRIFEKDPDILVQHVVKLCSLHYTRGTDPLVPEVGTDVVQYLCRFRSLESPEDIANWHTFCRTHSNKKLRDWYEHKVRYSWLLPGFNASLSRMPRDRWNCTPHHTNLVESAHVATNRATNINLLPLEAIQRARILDAEVAASILKAKTECILHNRLNHESTRMARSISRTSGRQKLRREHSDLENGISDTRKELADATQRKKTLDAKLKALNTEKKDLGRTPRHNTAAARKSGSSTIPKLVGLTPRLLLDCPSSPVACSSSPSPEFMSSPSPSTAATLYDLQTMPPRPSIDTDIAASDFNMFDDSGEASMTSSSAYPSTSQLLNFLGDPPYDYHPYTPPNEFPADINMVDDHHTFNDTAAVTPTSTESYASEISTNTTMSPTTDMFGLPITHTTPVGDENSFAQELPLGFMELLLGAQGPESQRPDGWHPGWDLPTIDPSYFNSSQ